jgi:hypothetical protein
MMPQLNELVVFLMCLSVFLLVLLDGTCWSELSGFLFGRPEAGGDIHLLITIVVHIAKFCLFLLAIAGMIITSVNVFSSSEMGSTEMELLTGLAIIILAFSGIAAGIHLLSQIDRLTFALILLPGYNLLCGYIYILFYMHRLTGKSFDRSYQVRTGQLLLSSAVIVLAIALLRFVAHSHWSITLTVCVSMCTGLDKISSKLISPPISR